MIREYKKCELKQIYLVEKKLKVLELKYMAMRRIFWGFFRNWFLMSPLHYLSSRVFNNRLPASVSRGVDKFARSIHFFQTFT